MKRWKAKSTEKGLTLVESLAAIVIFSLTITAVTTPIMIAMASRVKAHRANQALQLAQGEIDRVRLILEEGNTAFTNVNQFISYLPPDGGGGTPQAVAAPTYSNALCSSPPTQSAVQACGVDIDKDGQWDFGVQTFRTRTQEQPKAGGPNVPIAFYMGVRVYTRAAIESSGTLSTQPASLALSAATTSSKAPLAVFYTPIVRSDLAISADKYRQLLGR